MFWKTFSGWSTEWVDHFRDRYLLELYAHAPLKAGALEVLNALHRFHRIIMVTGRNPAFPGIKETTVEWLARGRIPYDRLIMNDSPHLHHFSKLNAVLDNGIALMIEDHPGLCQELAPHIPVIMFAQPYNEGVSAPGITRAGSWGEVDAALHRLGFLSPLR